MNLTQEQWWSQLQEDENAVIVDVRTEDEVATGKIPMAINLDIYKGQGFIYLVEELQKDKNYYVYCQAGMRSLKACEIMNELGITNAYNLVGGINLWNGPLE